MGRFLTSTVAAVIFASSSAVCADGLPSGTGTKLPPDAQAAIDHAKSLSKAFRAISKLAGPSVVSVEVTPDVHRMMGGMRMAPGMQLPPGFQMFQMGPGGMQPMQQPMQQVPKEMGTGFIVAEEGYVVTNNHVVKDGVGGTVMVHLNDGREASAQVVGTDPETDIAVLRIDMPNLKAIEFADSDQADVGDWVIALGAPFGLKDSVTAGIISAKGREVGLSPLESYLQTDATINPGNSGGPLVDMDGHVVGINTAIESRSGGSDGIGFAIPANMAKGVVESIIAGNAPSRGFLGIQMQPLDRQLAANFGFDGGGVLVNQVVPGGAAERAGVKVGDILVKVNGEAVPSLQRVQRAVKLCKPGSECPIEVFRDGGTVTLAAQLDDSSKQVAAATAPAPAIRLAPDAVQQHAAKQREPASLGIEVAAITPAMAKERGMADTHGVAVTKVADGGAAARAGLKEGDIIRQVGGNTVSDPSEWDAAVRKVTAHGRSVRLLVERDGASKFLLLRS